MHLPMPGLPVAPARRWFLIPALLLVAATLMIALAYRQTTPAISDTIGYVQASHQIARGEGLAYADPHNAPGRSYYTLYAFKANRPGAKDRYFGFPPALPWLAAQLERLTGQPDAVHWLVPLLAALLAGLAFALGALLYDPWTGVFGSAILLAAPAFLPYATAMWSEIPSAAFIYAGLVVYFLSHRLQGRRAAVLAALGGALLGVAFFVRYASASVLLALPVMLAGVNWRGRAKDPRNLAFGGMVALALAGLLAFNQLYFGGPLITGYSPLHGWYEQPAFSVRYALGPSFVKGYSLPALAASAWRQMSWLLICVVAALVPRFAAPRSTGLTSRSTGLKLFAIAGALALPYGFYAFPAEGINERFVIPALPALALLAGRGLAAGAGWVTRSRVLWARAATVAVLAGWLVYRLPGTIGTLRVQQQPDASVLLTEEMAQTLEPDAVVMAYAWNDLFAVYGQRSVLNYRSMPTYDPATGRYDTGAYPALLVQEIRRLQDAGTPVYYIADAAVVPFETDRVLREHFRLISAGPSGRLFRVDRPPES